MSREEESGEGEHADLMQNNTLQVYGYTESETRTGDRTRKKPKNLSVCEREERRYWEGGGVYTTLMESDWNLVPQKQPRGEVWWSDAEKVK